MLVTDLPILVDALFENINLGFLGLEFNNSGIWAEIINFGIVNDGEFFFWRRMRSSGRK